MKIVGISFSYADNSLQTRGLELIATHDNTLDSVHSMSTFNMPMCDSNMCDGQVPDSVKAFDEVMEDADALVFAVSEATAHYTAGFKNAMDWLVVKSRFNETLGEGYSISGKPVLIVTFSPTKEKPNGARHFPMTVHLLEKLGAQVVSNICINNAWETVVPEMPESVKVIVDRIHAAREVHVPNKNKLKKTEAEDSSIRWLNAYTEWDEKWKRT